MSQRQLLDDDKVQCWDYAEYSHRVLLQRIFSFILNTVFVTTNKPNTKRNKTVFILYAPDFPPPNSCVKEFVVTFFSMLGLIIALIKNIKQNIQENILQCWF